jgi:hypothetical protein
MSAGPGWDTKGNSCLVAQACFQIGLGLYGGGGMTFTAGAPQPLSNGNADSWGLFANVGSGYSVGSSINFNNSSLSGATGFGGGGVGAAAGVQFCRTYTRACGN